MTRVAITGAAGRMGQALIRGADATPGLQVTAAIERDGHPLLGQDAGTVAGLGALGLAISADLARVGDADVLIDFSDARAVSAHVRMAAQLGKAVVIGTTGLDAATELEIRQAATRVGVVWSPNMSVGVNLLFELVKQAARALGLDYDAELVETHHRHKKDAPSGTALYLAKAVAAGREQDLAEVVCYGREGMPGARPRGEIGIHAVRSGAVVGDHVLTLASDTEIVSFSHRAMSRDVFAVGALRAAAWVAPQAPGLYGMRDVLAL